MNVYKLVDSLSTSVLNFLPIPDLTVDLQLLSLGQC